MARSKGIDPDLWHTIRRDVPDSDKAGSRPLVRNGLIPVRKHKGGDLLLVRASPIAPVGPRRCASRR